MGNVPKMKKTIGIILLLPFLAAGLSSCASKEKEEENHYTGKFMESDQSRSNQGNKAALTLSEVFEKEREKREEKRLKFQDVSRPMNQDSFKIFPWKSGSTPRSEELHDASREGSNSIF